MAPWHIVIVAGNAQSYQKHPYLMYQSNEVASASLEISLKSWFEYSQSPCQCGLRYSSERNSSCISAMMHDTLDGIRPHARLC